MDILVWPGRVVVPFLPGDYSDLEASCVGHLYVQLLEAKDLANKDIVGRSDPYVVLFVRRRKDLVKESSQMHDTSEPVWNEQFLFNVEDPTVQKLTIKVMNLDETNLDVFVGIAELAINQFHANTQEDLWIDLAGDPSRLRGKCAGRLHLLIEFRPLNLSNAKNDSSCKTLGESLHSTAPSTQSAENSHTIGERSRTGVNNASEGLRAVLDGSEKNASKPISFTDVVASSSMDSPGLDRDEVTHPFATDNGLLPSQEDKTETAHRIYGGIANSASRDDAVIAECSFPPECESSEKRANGFGITASDEGIVAASQKESEKTSRDFSEGSSIFSVELKPNTQVVENIPDSELDTENEVMKRHNIIAGDPAWGLNGLSVEHCSSCVIHEDMFSTEIFEVD